MTMHQYPFAPAASEIHVLFRCRELACAASAALVNVANRHDVLAPHTRISSRSVRRPNDADVQFFVGEIFPNERYGPASHVPVAMAEVRLKLRRLNCAFIN